MKQWRNYKYILHIDLETYSPVDIKKAGAYRYAEEAEILILGYGYHHEEIHAVDLARGEELNPYLWWAIESSEVLKVAQNAPFEMAVLSRALGIKIDPKDWICTAVLAARAGYPMSLDGAASALGLEQQKDSAGKALIRYFCSPCKPTKANGGRTRNLPEHDPQKWEAFLSYCKQDIATEKAIFEALLWVHEMQPEEEHRLWVVDQEINNRGVKVDLYIAQKAVEFSQVYSQRLLTEAAVITGLDNPNSVAQLKTWLENELDQDVISLTKDSVSALLKSTNGSEPAARMLEIRSELAKSSVKKYLAMLACAGEGNRIRGLLQFYGASKTGRWAGRLLQVQNLPRISLSSEDLDIARNILLSGDIDLMQLCFGSIPHILSQLIRTALIPDKGNELLIDDFSAIEARVLAWLAGEQWRLNVFRTTGKIYEASAAAMFKVPVESIGKENPLRQKGKVAELACGYQGGANALIRMGAIEGGVVPQEILALPEDHITVIGNRAFNKQDFIEHWLTENIIRPWRAASPAIVSFWYELEQAAIDAILSGERVYVRDKLSFYTRRGALIMQLPSGRPLHYPGAHIKTEVLKKPVKIATEVNGKILVNTRFEEREVTKIYHMGVDQVTGKWGKKALYGGLIAENCLSGRTKVLTLRGVIDIVEVTSDDLLWDGVEWVCCGGVVHKGQQETISLNGLFVTKDHKILTENGWKNASSCQGHIRRKVRVPNGYKVRKVKRGKINMAVSVERLARTPFTISPGFQEPVFDIVNAGPRNRFTVLDGVGIPLIVHNCTQAVARDCLANAILNLHDAGYPVIMHVHDECVVEAPAGSKDIEEMHKLMLRPARWMKGLPLDAEGIVSPYYTK